MITAQRVVGNGGSLLLCPTVNGEPTQYRPTLRNGKLLTANKSKPSETLTERFRGLAAFIRLGYPLIMEYTIMLL